MSKAYRAGHCSNKQGICALREWQSVCQMDTDCAGKFGHEMITWHSVSCRLVTFLLAFIFTPSCSFSISTCLGCCPSYSKKMISLLLSRKLLRWDFKVLEQIWVYAFLPQNKFEKIDYKYFVLTISRYILKDKLNVIISSCTSIVVVLNTTRQYNYTTLSFKQIVIRLVSDFLLAFQHSFYLH